MSSLNASSGQLSSSAYAERRKELLKLVNQLRAIGAQSDLDLPRIAVIGNQSAGKSSVVEAISGITVPRDAGTCTRCPMECRLASSASSWSCQISIRWEFHEDNKPRDDVKEVLFGALIDNPADVELNLRRAQAAILNPHLTAESFLRNTREELSAASEHDKLRFSRNVVCLDISGPGLTDLSFIDLPGLVQNAEPEIVTLVEGLVTSHIKGNTLILVALPMTDDIENQKAVRLARLEDPTGRRTIGVMTKPDMLTSGATKARDLWLDVIEGRRHQLAHGYYCTRQPNDEERAKGITASEARKAEEEFFKATSPWSHSTQQSRFGTRNLVSTLSGLLTQIINEALPKIQKDAQNSMEACVKELDTLPHAIEQEPATFILQLLTAFNADIKRFVDGDANSSQLLHQNRETFSIFKHDIRSTAPNFKPYLNSWAESSRWENSLGDDNDEDNVMELTALHGKGFYLKDMQKYIEQSITRELPDNVPFDAKVRLIQEFQGSWTKIAIACFQDVHRVTMELLSDRMKIAFGRFDSLHHQLRTFVNDLATTHYSKCLEYIKTFLKLQQTPYTQNTHYLQTCKDKWLAKYKDARAGKTKGMLDPAAGGPSKRRKTAAPEIGKSQFSFANPPSATSHTPFTFGSGAPAASTLNSTEQPLPTWGTAIITPGAKVPAPASGSVFGSVSALGSRPQGTPSTSGAAAAQSPSPSASLPIPALPVPFTAAPRSVTAETAGGEQSTESPERDEKINAALAMLAELGYVGLTAEDLGKLNPPDEYETELEVMAEVRGYFQVTYKRVIDDIPQLVDLLFVKAIARDLQQFLIGKLGLGTEQASARCRIYLAEDPLIVSRRGELVGRKKRLQAVMEQLYGFGV